MNNAYERSTSNVIERTISQLFAVEKINRTTFPQALTQAIIKSFSASPKKSDNDETARQVLEHVLGYFKFQFSGFLNQYLLKKSEIKKLTIALLYGLYFKDIDLSEYISHNRHDNLEYLTLQIAAENVSKTTLKKILRLLSFDKLLSLICFVFRRYREGSFFILKEIEALISKKKTAPFSKESCKAIQDLITGLRNKYYDAEMLLTHLMERPKVNEAMLSGIINDLEQHSYQEAQKLQFLMHRLVPLMVRSPVDVFDKLESLKKQTLDNYSPNITGREEALKQQKNFEKLFAGYLERQYTISDFQSFLQIYGLRGHVPRLAFQNELINDDTIVGKINVIHQVFSNPLLAAGQDPQEVLVYFAFVLQIVIQLEAICFKPSQYIEGLNILACAIPTLGKELETKPILFSILRGFKVLFKTIKKKLKDYPIFIFDQSDDLLFLKNRHFITGLNRHYKSSIVHISLKETLDLAKKIKIQDLLDTTKTGALGFSGARNCVFLLAPVLKEAFQLGIKTVQEVLKMDDKDLTAIFNTHVLGGIPTDKTPGDTVLMFDDDMEISASNILAHVLFAKTNSERYVAAYGFEFGRGTKSDLLFQNLEPLLNSPSCFAFTEWLSYYTPAWLSEYISKPKIFLNLPLGNEERLFEIRHEQNMLLKPSIHLCGTRYPKTQLPTRPFVGLETHLERFIPTVIQMAMVMDLIDPLGVLKHSILPWHDDFLSKTFSCLKEALIFISNPQTKKAMQVRIWKNLEELFYPKSDKRMLLRQNLDDLLSTNVDGTLKRFASDIQLKPKEKASLSKIGLVYKNCCRDAECLWEFGIGVIETIKHRLKTLKLDSSHWYEDCVEHPIDIIEIIEKQKSQTEHRHGIKFIAYPITNMFYLLILATGGGTFCEAVERLIPTRRDF